MSDKTPRKRSKRRNDPCQTSDDWRLNPSIKALDRKALMIRVPHETWRRLKHAATDHDTSIQKLAVEALDYILKKYGTQS